MHVSGIYFINHKAKNYFPESADLLNLSVTPLKEKEPWKSNYFRVIQTKIRKINMGNTQPAHNVPWTSHEGSLNVRGYKGPTGDSHGTNKNIDDVMKKLFFRSNRPCITYLSLFFTGRANIQKF